MKIPVKVTKDLEVYSIDVCAKVRDSGCYTLADKDGNECGETIDGYVPSFFPDDGGDYLNLNIEIETGRILNWKRPTPEQLVTAFFPKKDEE